MDPLTLAAGSALVAAMATDSWQHCRDTVADWWRQRHANRTDGLDAALDHLRTQVLATGQEGDQPGEDALTVAWGERFQRLLDSDPHMASEIRELIDRLTPAASSANDRDTPVVTMKADARDNARIFMAGRDQHITGS
ncbi:hypothetical protein N7925_10430 [Streptomyces sp. CA-278952]|uniref:hypothetical protein n=1 Tax=Streptomyces sp. CA-278952 TaxID=2980556 RepID=UPI002368B0C7|nr:hypothetical protein [Streptomyces sp. CA-278952]WDG28731.1 hypothetical protein N7925_10430 [Streptomyces sp. CA-278952]